MGYHYPILNKVFDYYKTQSVNFTNKSLFACMHLLEPQLKMFEMLIDFGFTPENIHVIGKAYSTNQSVLDELKYMRINAQQPDFSNKNFDDQHSMNCRMLSSNINEVDCNIILDDGGELIKSVQDKRISFAVEQTSSGYRKLENNEINFPIFNVARSKTKLTQESPLVARQCWDRIENYIDKEAISNPKILIIGLGPIGSSIKQLIESENIVTEGIDIETEKKDLISYLNNETPTIVIGATGSSVLKSEDLDKIRSPNTYHFISVSSSDREFPVSAFRDNNNVHDDVIYKNFVFVNNGFPISFKGNRNELTPIEIEKTIALLLGSVLHGVTKEMNVANGFIKVPKILEELVN